MQANKAFIAKIASWYYEKGLTQEQIARRTRISRPSISRLLSQARRDGIVQMRVIHPEANVSELERKLEEAYGLREAIVVPVSSQDRLSITRSLARAAGPYLARVLREGDVLGIPWGHTVYNVVQELPRCHIKHLRCVQLCGGVAAISEDTDSAELVRSFAISFGGSAFILRAPLFHKSKEVRDTLFDTEPIKTTVGMFKEANIAVAGVGALSVSILTERGLLSRSDVMGLRQAGAVGDICSRFFNEQGEFVDVELHDRTLAIPIDQLKKIKHFIAVAGGESKRAAILGALRTGVVNVLITDDQTAHFLTHGILM